MNNNFFYKHRKSISAFTKKQTKKYDVDTLCLMWLADQGLNQNTYINDLNAFMKEWNKRLQKNAENASKWFHGEID